MNAIVLSFDRLPVTFLGCYGNGWVSTPAFDRLAATSVVFDRHYAAAATAPLASQAWWSGRYASHPRAASMASLGPLLRANGITVRVLYEAAGADVSAELGDLPGDCIEAAIGADGLDVKPDETPFLRLVGRAQRELRTLVTSRSEPWVLWLNSRGVPTPWLPPREFAVRHLDIAEEGEADIGGEENDEDEAGSLVDLSPADFDRLLQSAAGDPQEDGAAAESDDWREQLRRRVFAGYVSLLDSGLGQFLAAIEPALAAASTLLVVTAARGASIHAASELSGEAERLCEEAVHSPLLIRPPGMIRGVRRQTLVQPIDLPATLAEWFDIAEGESAFEGKSLWPTIRGAADEVREWAFTASERFAGIRSRDFYLVRERVAEPAGDGVSHLFVKPDDIADVNNVATQFPQVVDEMSTKLDQFLAEEGNG